MGIQKQLLLQTRNLDIKFNFTEHKKDPNSTDWTLIVPGWQSCQEIFDKVIEGSKDNIIIFDYPGISKNSEIPSELCGDSLEILENAIKEIIEKYNITKAVGTSAGSTLLVYAYHKELLRTCKNIYLMSPQLTVVALDQILGSLFRAMYFVTKFFKIPLYRPIFANRLVSKIWANVVSQGAENPETFKFVQKGIKISHNKWTPKQFLDMYSLKKNLKPIFPNIIKDKKVEFLIGKKDNLFDKKGFQETFLDKGLEQNRIHELDGNHVLELEAVEELLRIIGDKK